MMDKFMYEYEGMDSLRPKKDTRDLLLQFRYNFADRYYDG